MANRVHHLRRRREREDKNKNTRDTTNVRIYSSQLSRAYETATAIAEKLSSLSSSSAAIPVTKTPALKEWHLGCLEGTTQTDATQNHPKDWSVFREWSNPYVCEDIANLPIREGGESMEQVRSRAVRFLQETVLRGTANESGDGQAITIAVTHGGVLGQLLRHVVSAQYQHDDSGILHNNNNNNNNSTGNSAEDHNDKTITNHKTRALRGW